MYLRSVLSAAVAALALLAAAVYPARLAAQDSDLDWPKEIGIRNGRIVIYLPQVESFEGNRLISRAAVSVHLDGEEEPAFGAVWFDTRVSTDRDERTVTLLEAKISDIRFPNITQEQDAQFRALVEAEIPKWHMVMSLDNLLTALEAAEMEQTAAENLKMDPPKIIVVDHAAILISVDGDPVLRKIEDSDMMRVVNTPYLMVFDPGTKSYYLNGGYEWYKAAAVAGPWEEISQPPAKVVALAPAETVEESGLERTRSDYEKPQVIVETVAAELIATDGEPAFTPLPGNELLYISNTESDVLMEIASQQYYVLLSGRWYRAGSLQNGPWSYVPPDQLPSSFTQIPAGSGKGHLRAQVPGTQEAKDAVMDAQIPQTAAISRKDAKLDVQYDGEPVFEQVEGTDMTYATNTSTSVLKIGDLYYSCDQGVWFKSGSASGPWELADSVPAEVQQIPPSNPNYNVKYVYVYDSTPEVVYVGYTPAYTGCYHHHGTVVYGTGWYYRPWIGPYYYYPRSWTFGFSVRYNPWTGGWGFGFSAGYGGFRFSFGWGSGWYGGPWWGPRPGFWGVGGYRAGMRHGYRAGFRAGYRAGQISSRPRPSTLHAPARGNASIHARDRVGARDRTAGTADRSNLYDRAGNRDRVSTADRSRVADRSNKARTRENAANNVFADRNGDVYRRGSDGWERKGAQGWDRANPPSAGTRDRVQPGQPAQRDRSAAGSRPSTSQRPSTAARPSTGSRPSISGGSRLDRDYNARQRGNSRTQSYQRQRSPSRAQPRARPSRGRRR